MEDYDNDELSTESVDPDENEPSEEAQLEQPDPHANRKTVQFWRKWITGAKKAAKHTWEDTKEANREYDNGRRTSEETERDETEEYARTFPLYWSVCETVAAAYYARQPKVICRREFDINDGVALTASLIAERLSIYNMKNTGFDSTMHAAVMELLHGSKSCTQLIAKEDSVEVDQQVPVIPQGDLFVDQAGNAYTDVIAGANNQFFANIKSKVLVKKVGVKPVIYNEILHTPEAKCQEDITEIALHFEMDAGEAEERFGRNEDGSKREINLQFKSNTSYHDEDSDRDRADIPGRYLEGWEIWDYKTKTVRWIDSQGCEEFLDEKPDLFQLAKFFPITKFVLTNKPTSNLYPRNNYSRLRPILNQLHDLYARKFRLIDGIRRRCLVDGSEPELIDALNSLDSTEYIACKNLQTMLEKGGISNLVLFVPVQELVQAISEINSIVEEFKTTVYEIWGVPDILRSVSDPQEALGTQQIKYSAAHDRFKITKIAVQEMVRESIEMMLDLSVKIMPPEQIAEIVGLQFMGPEHQQRFLPALELLKNDQARIIRIDLETDSTSFIDQQAEILKRKTIADTVINGLAMLGKMENQEFAPVVLQTLLYTLSAVGGSKEFEDQVIQSVRALIARKNQPAPPAPPPPDYERMKIELKAMESQAKSAIEQRKLDQQAMELSLEERDREFSRELEVIKTQMDNQMQKFIQASEAQRLQNERYEVIMSQRERMIEEQRLALEAALQMQEKFKMPELPPGPQIIQVAPPEIPPITINLKAEPKKRRARIIRDELGGAMLEIDDAAPEIVPIG